MSFHMPIGHLYVFSGEMTRSSVHFFDWVALLLSLLLSCMNSFVFWKWSPCQWNHLQIFFSQFIDYLFIMFMVFFAVQKFISLISFHLSIFAFFNFFNFFLFLLLFQLTWETELRKHWYNLCQRRLCLYSFLGVL